LCLSSLLRRELSLYLRLSLHDARALLRGTRRSLLHNRNPHPSLDLNLERRKKLYMVAVAVGYSEEGVAVGE
jgi:hypothetical protein